MYISTKGTKKQYHILTHSYWDKEAKVYKKKRLYLGEHPVLTRSLQKRIQALLGVREIPKHIQGFFDQSENGILQAILREVPIGKVPASKHLENQLYDLEQAHPDLLDHLGIHLFTLSIWWKKLGKSSVTSHTYTVRQSDGLCHRYFATGRYCERPIQSLAIRGKQYPYCEKHRKEDAGRWNEKEWNDFKKRHSLHS